MLHRTARQSQAAPTERGATAAPPTTWTAPSRPTATGNPRPLSSGSPNIPVHRMFHPDRCGPDDDLCLHGARGPVRGQVLRRVNMRQRSHRQNDLLHSQGMPAPTGHLLFPFPGSFDDHRPSKQLQNQQRNIVSRVRMNATRALLTVQPSLTLPWTRPSSVQREHA